MDEAGFEPAHIVGNSLGGYIALRLAERGRARTVVALAPAGGWAKLDRSREEVLELFRTMQQLLKPVAPSAEAMVASREGRRAANSIHRRQVRSHPGRAARPPDPRRGRLRNSLCPDRTRAWPRLDRRSGADRLPVRIIWGTADRLLPWPTAAARYRADWLLTPTGSSSTASATARSSTSHSKPRS